MAYDSDDDDGEIHPVVIDLGSGMTKGGIAGDDEPKAVIPCIIVSAKLMEYLRVEDVDFRGKFVGNEAQIKRGICKISSPIENGVVNDWDDLEILLHHMFYNELRVAPEDHPVLFSHPILNPKANLEKLRQISFETFTVPAFFSAIDTVLSFYSHGRTTGLSISCGHGVTSMFAMYEGYSIIKSARRINVAGDSINTHLKNLLTERGYSFNYSNEMQSIQEIKEKHCFTSLDYQHDIQLQNQNFKEFELPDGQKIHIGNECFRAPEILFNPSLIGENESSSIHNLAYESIMSVDIDARHDLYANICLAGGTTMLPKFNERFHKELVNLAPTSTKIRVTSSKERKNSVWIGGSILASFSNFQQMWITKEEYDESGPSVIIRRNY